MIKQNILKQRITNSVKNWNPEPNHLGIFNGKITLTLLLVSKDMEKKKNSTWKLLKCKLKFSSKIGFTHLQKIWFYCSQQHRYLM